MVRERVFYSRWAWALAAVLVAAIATGCGVHPRRLAEKRVEAQLPQLIGPAKRYRVYLFGRHERMFQGKVKAVRIVGEGVEIQPGLVLRELVVELEEIVYQPDKPLQAQRGVFHATLSDETLSTYLTSLLPPIRSPWNLVVSRLDNLRVRSRAGEIRLSIEVHTRLGVKLSGELSGQLRLREHKQVWLEASEVKVVGLTVPEKVRDLLAELFLNRPLIDLSEVQAPIRVDRIAIGEGMVMVEGIVLVEQLAQRMRG